MGFLHLPLELSDFASTNQNQKQACHESEAGRVRHTCLSTQFQVSLEFVPQF